MSSKSRTRKVDICIQKIYDYCDAMNLSDSRLSKRLGMKRGWFCSVKKRAKNGIASITIDQAQKMTEVLNCEIQDITSEEELFHTPLFIDYRRKASDILDEINEHESRRISNILETYQKHNSDEKDMFQGLLEDIAYRKKIRGREHQDWWKYLVVSDLIETVFDSNLATDYSGIKQRFLNAIDKQKDAQRRKEENMVNSDTEKDPKLRVKSKKTAYDQKVDEMQKILTDEWEKIVTPLIIGEEMESSLRKSAYALVGYILLGKDSDRISLLKNGNWRIGLLLRYDRY